MTRALKWSVLAVLPIVAATCAPSVLEPGGQATLVDEAGLQFSVTWAPREPSDSLRWVGQVSNPTDQPSRVEFGDCALSIDAFTPSRTIPVWVSQNRGPYGSDAMYLCLAYLGGVDLAPGQTQIPLEFQLSVPLLEVLGDSLPNGPYRFEAWFELKDRRVGPLSLGEATLER